MLRDAGYLNQVVNDLLSPQATANKIPVDEEKRIKTLAARGLFGRIARDEDITVADPSSVKRETIEQLFPQGKVPDHLPLPATHCISMSYPDISAAARHMSRGKASGLSGWTRELFMPLLHNPVPAFQQSLTDIFTSIVNVTALSPEEKNLLTSSWLCLLQYKNKPNKLRPICIRDFISKIIWTHLISTNGDIFIHVPGSSYRKKGGCAAVAQALQCILDNEKFLVALDAENAFNCCSRNTVFEYVLSRGSLYFDMFPFLNLFYASITVVNVFAFSGGLLYVVKCSSGAAQGCSSGPFFFHICILHLNRKFPDKIINVADDIYIVNPDEATLTRVLQLLGMSGLTINAGKCAIVGSRRTLSQTQIPDIAALLPLVTVSPAPFSALGTFIIPDWPLALGQRVKYINGSLELICGKIRRRAETIQNMNASLQIKFLTLRDSQIFCLYCIQAASHYLVPQLCKYLEDLFLTVIQNLIGFGIPSDRHHLLYKPLEVGGLGMVPFADLCRELRDNLQQFIAQILDGVSIKHDFQSNPPKSLNWLWRHIASTRALAIQQRSQDEVATFSWLSTWPNIGVRQFSDREFGFALSHLLQMLAPVSTTCVFRGKSFDFTASTACERHAHWFSCGRCGSAQFHHRHECALAELVSTTKFHNTVVTKYPSNMPVPGKKFGGADFLMFSTNNTLTGATLVGDVAITHLSRMGSVFASKIRQYKTFSPAINGTTFPFVINTRGIVCRKTIQIMRDKHFSPTFIRDACVNTSCAMIKALAASYFNLAVRPRDDPNSLGENNGDDMFRETVDDEATDLDDD
jgi:hypothetical protein